MNLNPLADKPYDRVYSEKFLSEYILSLKSTPCTEKVIKHLLNFHDNNFKNRSLFQCLDSYLFEYYRATIKVFHVDRPQKYRKGTFYTFATYFYKDIKGTTISKGFMFSTDPLRNYCYGYCKIIKETFYKISVIYETKIIDMGPNEWRLYLEKI